MSLSPSSRKYSLYLTRVALLALATVPVLLSSGCGIGTAAESASPAVTSVHGVSFGGPNPIVNASVKLYATTTTAGYGTGGTLLASTTTNALGGFDFGNTAATCPSGQQAYLTVTGGNTGANTNNPQSLLLAALGPCTTISTATNIWADEVTTVAAGYALSNFMTIDGSGVVHISAPATNNAATPACSGTGTGMTCTAAGLAHAFLNALNLANSVSPTGTPVTTGQAYTTVPGNSNSVVPTLLLNTLGNIFQSCVNSTGGVASDTSTPCGKLFSATTPPTTSVLVPVVPTNTLQAVLNLAKYPTLTPANVTALFALSTPQQYYLPALAAAPNDYSLAITYRGPTPATAFYTFFTVMDIADSTYSFNETGNGSGPVSVAGMTSNGTILYQGPTITGALCTASSPCSAGVDTLGHLWLANTNTASNQNVYEIKTSDGSVLATIPITGTSPNSAAVDKFNDVFVTSATTTATLPNLYELTAGGSSFAAVSANGTPEIQTANLPEYLAIDSAGNVWNTNFGTSAQVTFNQNTSAANVAPTFANAFVTTTAGSTASTYGISFDAAGNAWANTLTTLYKIPAGASPTVSTFTISGTGGNAATVGNPVAATSARFNYQDGDGNIFTSDNGKNSVYQFFPATTNFIYMIPCTGNSGTACITAGQRVAAARNVVTDSTGSIWVSDPSATVGNGNIAQIIGTAAPTWGQQSYGKPGVRP